MPKRKNLNGIPHNITKSFFGTERYYNGGYMGDWLLNGAKRLQLTKASLDVLKVSFNPTQLNIHPLTLNAKDLKTIIHKELVANGFEANFIKEATIDFQFPDPKIYKTTFYCLPYLVDKDGKRYEAGRIIEEGLEPEFDPFDELNIYPTKIQSRFFDKFKNLFG
jgi:hypothetical protein